MRYCFLLFLFFISNFAFSQNHKCPEFSITTINSVESRTLNNDFFNHFYFGDFIDSTTKWDAVSNLNIKNSIGFFSFNEAEIHFPSENKLSVLISSYTQNIFGLGFNKDVFQLVFAGNNAFVGKKILASPLSLNQHFFSTIMGGISYKLNENISLNAAAGPVALFSYAHFDFSNSSFYTSSAVDSLTLVLEGEYCRTGGPTFIKGMGLNFATSIKGNNGGYDWKFGISNLGLAWTNNKAINTKRDTTINFNGIEISDLSNISAAVKQELDAIENRLNLKGDTSGKSIFLPLLISAECSKNFGKLRTDLNILYYNLPGFFPYVQLSPSYALANTLRVSLPIKFGGFGSVNVGPGFEIKISDKLSAVIEMPMLFTPIKLSNNVSYNVVGKLIFKCTDHASLL